MTNKIDLAVSNQEPKYCHIDGVVFILGYGSIGKGIFPMIKKKFTFKRLVVMDPIAEAPNDSNVEFMKMSL